MPCAGPRYECQALSLATRMTPYDYQDLNVSTGMDLDAGGGNILQNLPCTLQHHQLKCSGQGPDYPSSAISKYVDDNKALLRRMSGIQERKPKTVKKKTSIKVIRTFSPDKYTDKFLSS